MKSPVLRGNITDTPLSYNQNGILRERNCGLHFWGRKQLLKGDQQSKCVTGPVDFSYPFAVIRAQMNV